MPHQYSIIAPPLPLPRGELHDLRQPNWPRPPPLQLPPGQITRKVSYFNGKIIEIIGAFADLIASCQGLTMKNIRQNRYGIGIFMEPFNFF